MKRWMLLLLFYLLTGSYSFSQDDQCRKSTEGKDFWFGFMESRNYKPNHYLEITVTARETTTFSIKIGPDEVPFGNSYTVNANNSLRVKIPW
ncbi:MAG TPA: hypothetical protein VJ919_09795, partial [Tangfeifania sp.]|nr:hypothetical protein [Tangfeifania sp.]